MLGFDTEESRGRLASQLVAHLEVLHKMPAGDTASFLVETDDKVVYRVEVIKEKGGNTE